MEELAVIPECFVDTCLAETITNATHFNHQKGCGTVSKLMQEKLKDKFALGIVDKDKKLLPYLIEFDLVGSQGSLFLYKHRNKSHYIIQIFPAIEKFILKAVDEKGIHLADYNLPNTLTELTKITKNITSKKSPVFKQLFQMLADTTEFLLLAEIIGYLASNTYNCDIEELRLKLQ
jgi:hypothetical protein